MSAKRIIGWITDIGIVFCAIYTCHFNQDPIGINLLTWLSALVFGAGLLGILFGDHKIEDPLWWDAYVRLAISATLASVGWFWLSVAWIVSMVGNAVTRERHKNKKN